VPAPAVSTAGESALWVDPAEIPSDGDIGKLGQALAEQYGEQRLAAEVGVWGAHPVGALGCDSLRLMRTSHQSRYLRSEVIVDRHETGIRRGTITQTAAGVLDHDN
jgi:hypothetical protein